ncbi:MAG: sporulation initiation factor Spo0A C-terminal domain-containing protein [Lachnospiraceae bacterium]|nr:sporulation initiation factor Spo0A C-terminal domain-containing protein [Lachnospiraceae bacterium]
MNDRIKVLLVEDNIDIRSSFVEYIAQTPIFELCGETGSEQIGLQILQEKLPDVLILDLELEEGDGVDFATEMRQLPVQQPFTIVLTNSTSEAIQSYLRSDLKIDFILQKSNASYSPKRVLTMASRTYKHYSHHSSHCSIESNAYIKTRIQEDFAHMHFDFSLKGTGYLIDALMELSDKNSELMPKQLYIILGKKNNTASANIEKAMRTSIENTWNTASLADLIQYYPYRIENKNGRPTNGEFLSNMKRRYFGA